MGLWSHVQSDKSWHIVVEALYMRPGDKVEPNSIWRESSLTQDVLARLRKGETIRDWLPELLSMSRQINTPRGRDSALLLAAIGEVAPNVYEAVSDESLIFPHGFFASLRFMAGFASSVVATQKRKFAFALNIAHKVDIGNSRSRSLSQFLGIKGSVARDLTAVLEKGVNVLDTKHAIKLAQAISLSLGYDGGVDEKIDDENGSEILLARAQTVIKRRLRNVIAPSDLVHALSEISSPVTNIPDAEHGEYDSVRALDVNRSFDFSYPQDYFEDIEGIKSIVRQGLRKKNIDQGELSQLKTCLKILDAAETNQVPGWIQSSTNLVKLIQTSRIVSKIEKTTISNINLAQISPEDLVSDLSSLEDERRYAILRALMTPSSALQLGRSCLEKMARLSVQYNRQPQIGTQLSWAIHLIKFDCLDWVRDWVELLAGSGNLDTAEGELLQNIHQGSPDVIRGLTDLIPHYSEQVNKAILHSLSWQAYLKTTPEDVHPAVLEKLQDWLIQEKEPDIVDSILDVFGHWRIGATVALRFILDWIPFDEVRPAWFNALARLGMISDDHEMQLLVQKQLTEKVHEFPFVASSLARFLLRNDNDYLIQLRNFIPDQERLFHALLSAGTDFDMWDDNYHKVLVGAIQNIFSQYPEELLPILLIELRESLKSEDDDAWPRRRITLAAVAACIEVMPTEMQRVAGGPHVLEALLIDGSKDPGSFNSRRFAINALGYLRVVTPSVAPILVNGLQDNVVIVQSNTLDSVARFQRFQGNLLPELLPYLTIEKAPATVYGIAKLLGAIGVSPAAEIASIRPSIIQGLADAIRHPNSQQEVILLNNSSSKPFETVSQGKLFDHLAQEMLRVAGWL